jgi:hypothetical protein
MPVIWAAKAVADFSIMRTNNAKNGHRTIDSAATESPGEMNHD